jgi:NAD(P)-dependent dehydrogenase (short-subunit alcohol dehydrogenase family)
VSDTKRVIVLGALSAVGEAVCRLYAAEGASLTIAGRDAVRLAQVATDLQLRGATVRTAAMDLAVGSPAQALDELVAGMGGVDHVLVIYGLLGDQARGETDEAHARAVLEVNFTSAALWCLAAAAVLETQGSGSLVAIGSVAGDRGRRSNYLYGAAKGGLAVLMQGLAHRLAASGARAVVVKPGFIDTPMTAHLAKGGPLWASPAAVARIVRRAADRGGPVVYAPWFWRWILLIVRLVPAPVFHKTKL